MNMRKITSLTALVSFVLLMLTSIILYIVPAGRVAYWSNWKLWGLSKEEWGAVHINLGFLLLVAILLHIYYNWAPMMSYMKNRARELRVFTPDFTVALLITLVVFWGTLAGIPPMSSIIHLGESISDQANLKYGEPPYGHAELSPLADFADKVKVDLDESLVRLETAGIKVETSAQTMQEISEKNGISPQQVFDIIKPKATSSSKSMPEEAPGGTGNRTVAQLCEMYQLNIGNILDGLKEKGIKAEANQTMKEIATANSIDPHAVYGVIFTIQQ